MRTHDQPHPLAGQTVEIKLGSAYSKHFEVEDWNDRVFGQWWGAMNGNFAALDYAVRSAAEGLPTDNEVCYGKIDGFGVMIHVSQLGDVVEQTD